MNYANLFPHLTDNSRVWIYQSNRIFNQSESLAINNAVNVFTANWAAHGKALKADGCVLNNVFLVLAVNEQFGNASGCSIDASVKFINEIATNYNLDFFDRMLQTFWLNQNPVQYKLNNLDTLLQSGQITEDTLVFDPLITKLSDLRSGFLKPIKVSWHARFISNALV